MKVQRYKIQQDKGQYCLKGCDDGDLMDYASHRALVEEVTKLLDTANVPNADWWGRALDWMHRAGGDPVAASQASGGAVE